MQMERIETIDELRQALRLEGIHDIGQLESRFEEIAKSLFNHFAIRNGDNLYRFVEIEFYHSLTDKEDGAVITYPRESAAGEWFMHDNGVDITFKSDEGSFGGILIRSIKADDREFINGPRNSMWEIFDRLDALSPAANCPVIVPSKNEIAITPARSQRWNIKTSHREYRYSYPSVLWPRPNNYQAYPWK